MEGRDGGRVGMKGIRRESLYGSVKCIFEWLRRWWSFAMRWI